MKCAVYQASLAALSAAGLASVSMNDPHGDILSAVRDIIAVGGYDYVARVRALPDRKSGENENTMRTYHIAEVMAKADWRDHEDVVYSSGVARPRGVGDIYVIGLDCYLLVKGYEEPINFLKIGGPATARHLAGEPMINLDTLDALCDKATQGPYFCAPGSGQPYGEGPELSTKDRKFTASIWCNATTAEERNPVVAGPGGGNTLARFYLHSDDARYFAGVSPDVVKALITELREARFKLAAIEGPVA